MAQDLIREINLEGMVVGIERGFSSIVLKVKSAQKTEKVNLYLGDERKIQSDIELIPYQTALMNQSVKYQGKIYAQSGAEAKLEILSGPLKGTSYYCSQRGYRS